MPRQFPHARANSGGDEVLIQANVAGLENLVMLINGALHNRHGMRDEAGQTRYGCKRGADSIRITVRNVDELAKLPECPTCKGRGMYDMVGDGDELACRSCHGTGRKMPDSTTTPLPFLT